MNHRRETVTTIKVLSKAGATANDFTKMISEDVVEYILK